MLSLFSNWFQLKTTPIISLRRLGQVGSSTDSDPLQGRVSLRRNNDYYHGSLNGVLLNSFQPVPKDSHVPCHLPSHRILTEFLFFDFWVWTILVV